MFWWGRNPNPAGRPCGSWRRWWWVERWPARTGWGTSFRTSSRWCPPCLWASRRGAAGANRWPPARRWTVTTNNHSTRVRLQRHFPTLWGDKIGRSEFPAESSRSFWTQVSEGYSGFAVCHTCAFKATMIVWDCRVCLCAALFISSHRGTKAANSSHTSALSLMSLTFIKHVWLPLWWCHSRIMNEGVSSEEKMRAGTWQPTSSTESPRHGMFLSLSSSLSPRQTLPRDVPELTRALTDVLELSNTLYTR